MWWQYLIVGILLLFSGIAKAVQDKLQFHFDKSVFRNVKNKQYWNPAISHRNKWKNGDSKQGEKFFLSSTWLVSLTDAWHLFGLIRDFLFVTSISVATLNAWYLIGYVIFFSTFHAFFTWIFRVKN